LEKKGHVLGILNLKLIRFFFFVSVYLDLRVSVFNLTARHPRHLLAAPIKRMKSGQKI
jgi:hypothetical protein